MPESSSVVDWDEDVLELLRAHPFRYSFCRFEIEFVAFCAELGIPVWR
jgi:hypothetical protein